jgi:hypothetical protein
VKLQIPALVFFLTLNHMARTCGLRRVAFALQVSVNTVVGNLQATAITHGLDIVLNAIARDNQHSAHLVELNIAADGDGLNRGIIQHEWWLENTSESSENKNA